MLDIRPLPQYETIEEAKKALGPRKIPSREVILAELAKLREPGEESDSDDDRGRSNHITGLIKEDSEYFGFMG